jgi:hypothetical protein
VIGLRGCEDKEEEEGLPSSKGGGISNNEGWQGEIQQSSLADGGEGRRGEAVALMIAASKMPEVSTMTMHTTKGGTKEDGAVHCPAAAAVATSLCPPPHCMTHTLPPLPLPPWWHGWWCGWWG